MTNPLYDALVEPHAERDGTLLVLDDGSEVSGRDFVRQVTGFAHTIGELGLQPGDRMAVQVEKSAEALALYAAALATGVVFLPLNTAYTPDELRYFVEDSEATLLIGDPEREVTLTPVADDLSVRFETLGAARNGSLYEKAEKAGDHHFRPVARELNDLAAILYTSGTTGRSKGAMLTQNNLLSNAQVLADAWVFTANDTLLHMLPIYHTHGLFVASNVALLTGAKMIFLPGYSTSAALKWLPFATTMMGVPTYYTRLLGADGFNRDLVRNIRLFTSGSAPLLAETFAVFERVTGHTILERYGMTETNMTTSNPYTGERRAGTVGRPLRGIEVAITDPESGKPMPKGEAGMIEVRGPNVFKGYWNMPEKTAEELRPNGFFITGDIGVEDVDGYVTIIGRQKDVIISGGLNIYPKEVETMIDDEFGVVESAVIGVPHPDLGEAVVAVVVPLPGGHPTAEGLDAGLRGRIANFKLPKHYVFVDELPRNTMGKVQKNLLRQAYSDLFKG